VTHPDDNKVEDVVLVSNDAQDVLNPRQEAMYREHRRDLVEWLLELGKDPGKADGYAHSTVKKHMWRLDKFYRWVWEHEADGYTTDISQGYADAWMKWLARQDYTEAYKADCMKACKVLFKWQNWRKNGDATIDWKPVVQYQSGGGTDNPRDFLTRSEREAVREAALEYGSVPSYRSLSPWERDRWKVYLAQRFGKPKSEVGPDDWDRANSFKIPSLVWVCLDAGLRPVEVERAVTRWVDVGNEVLRIPKEESSKNSDNWVVSLRGETVRLLEQWLGEREQYAKYDGSDALWLTREGNPYARQALNRVLAKLCDVAGIDTENRPVSWYSIRHSVGTYMTREEGLAAAQQQLRHKSEKTGKVLIFCDSIQKGKRLSSRLDVPFVHSKTRDRMDTFRDNRVVISSRVGDEGLSLDDIDVVVEYDFHGGSRRQEAQRVGRVMHGEGDRGEHIILMTDEEYENHGNRLYSLEEQGFNIRFERRM